ncbi:hypothetical protein EBB07_24570 [Paenibacillaceae bacterium]|nr:hypothetical protein EBB07_24570 [Paenibacillaceae bacterium]
MKIIGYILWTLIIVGLSALHIHALQRSSLKMRTTFWVLTSTGWLLGILVFHHPTLPGPNDLTKELFQPLGKWLKP